MIYHKVILTVKLICYTQEICVLGNVEICYQGKQRDLITNVIILFVCEISTLTVG